MRALAVFPLTIVLLAGLVAPPAHAEEDKKRAKKLLAQGDALFEGGNYEAALTKFQKAYEAFANPKIFFPMGKTEEKLGRDLDALAHYEQLLGGGGDLPAQLRDEVEERMRAIEQRIAIVDLSVQPAGAIVTVDDVELGPAPLSRPLRLAPGDHKIGATMEGLPPVERQLTLKPGDHVRESLALRKGASAKSTDVDAEVPEQVTARRSMPPHKKILWGGSAAVAALGVAAVVTGWMAKSDHDLYTDKTAPTADREGAQESGKTLAHLTDGLVLGALVVGGLTAYGYYHFAPRAEPKSLAGESTDVDYVGPFIMDGGAGLTVQGVFGR